MDLVTYALLNKKIQDVEGKIVDFTPVDASNELTNLANCVTDARFYRIGTSIFMVVLTVNNTLSSSAWTTLCNFPGEYGMPENTSQVAGNIAYGNAANVGNGGSVLVGSNNIDVRISKTMSESNHYAVVSAVWITIPHTVTEVG